MLSMYIANKRVSQPVSHIAACQQISTQNLTRIRGGAMR